MEHGETSGRETGMSRRTALKGIGSSTIAASIAPALLASGSEAGKRSGIVLGEGEHTYEWVEGWGRLPDGVAFGYTHGVCEDSQGRIYIHNQSKDATIIFDPDGNYITSWGEAFKDGAHGLQLSQEGNEEYLYLADYVRHIVVKTTLAGEEVWTLRYPKDADVYASEEEYKPTNVAIAPNGDFYVADGYGKSWIHQYNAKAEYIRSFGGPGSEPGKVKCPHGLWVDMRGSEAVLVVADRGNARLQYFTLDGKHIRFVTDELRHPCHFDQRGDDLLVPDLFGRVTIFNQDDELITHLGDDPGVEKRTGYPNLPHEQRQPGKFISPHSAIWDRDGNIYVTEWINDGRVTKLRRVA